MAYEIPGQMITLPSASTGLAQFTFVTVDGNGRAAVPADGASVVGVVQQAADTTSTGEAVNVMVSGVSKILAAGSTLAKGDLCATSTAGYATTLAATEYAIGRIIDGSSGSTGRVLSVLLQPIGTT